VIFLSTKRDQRKLIGCMEVVLLVCVLVCIGGECIDEVRGMIDAPHADDNQ